MQCSGLTVVRPFFPLLSILYYITTQILCLHTSWEGSKCSYFRQHQGRMNTGVCGRIWRRFIVISLDVHNILRLRNRTRTRASSRCRSFAEWRPGLRTFKRAALINAHLIDFYFFNIIQVKVKKEWAGGAKKSEDEPRRAHKRALQSFDRRHKTIV